MIVSQGFLTSHAYLKDSAAQIIGSQMASPVYSRSSNSNNEALSTKRAIRAALQQASLDVEDIQIIELRHGSNASAQQALGELHVTEDNSASPVTHPFVGTTGLAGLCELGKLSRRHKYLVVYLLTGHFDLVWQLRGWTRNRSIPKARNCLQYAMGPDGSAYVTILRRSDGQPAPTWEHVEHLRDGRERIGYNPAKKTKEISLEDWNAVKAPDNFVPESIAREIKFPVKGGDRAALARL